MTLATEGTQETLLKEQEGVGDDGDPAAPAANNKQAPAAYNKQAEPAKINRS